MRQLAQQRAEQRALAAAVGPEHRDDLAAARLEGDVGERVDARPVAAGEVPTRTIGALTPGRRHRGDQREDGAAEHRHRRPGPT